MRSTYNFKKQDPNALLVAFLVVCGFLGMLAFVAGLILLEAQIGFMLYRAYHPASWPYIGLKEWFGLAILIQLFLKPTRVFRTHRS